MLCEKQGVVGSIAGYDGTPYQTTGSVDNAGDEKGVVEFLSNGGTAAHI
jgi:hypothetical protein